LNNTINAFANWSVPNYWNTTKTYKTNILGGFWQGGNFWSDYYGNDTSGDYLGDQLLPWNSSGNISVGGTGFL